MLNRWQFWLLTTLAALSVALILANMYRFAENRKQQVEVNQRAQFVQQTIALETLNREILSALAQLAVRSQDEQIRSMLASMGVTMNDGAASTATTPAASGTPQVRKK